MASRRAHFLDWLIRTRVRPRLVGADVMDIRAAFDRRTLPDPWRATYEDGRFGGVPGEWVRPSPPRPGPEYRVLYLHGGGFVACSARLYRPLTGGLARRNLSTFAPDYRLAPEHPFPAAVEAALAAWTAFRAAGPAAIAGDSAGGNLVLSVMLRARDRGLPLPEAAVLFSPATDLAGTGASMRENAGTDAMFDAATLRRLGPPYLAGTDPADPRASPLYADLRGLPPLLIHVGERELLRDDSRRLAARAAEAGVPTVLTEFPVVPHAWQLASPYVPEARASLNAAAGFMRLYLDRARGA